MAEYNPSKIIKDGNTYNFRDTTKIPLAGSNQISGDLIPSTNNTIDIGSSSKKIKSVFAYYLNNINLSTLFDISNIGYMTDLNNDTLRVRGKIIVCSYGSNTLNIPARASGTCFTLANQDSTDYGVQVALSNKGIYARFINDGQYGAWQVIPGHTYNVYDKTLTIQKNGTNVATFTSNSNTDVTANITVPTKVSELTNDSGFLTSADRLPIGSYIQFAGSQAPAGFLVCNGGEISRTTYSALFDVIGTTYGSGDGSTTFNLPNLTDRFLQGSTTSGTVRDAGLPNVLGNIGAFSKLGDTYVISGAFGGAFIPVQGAAIQATSSSSVECNSVGFNASLSSPIYGSNTTVQPPALTCLICIKY